MPAQYNRIQEEINALERAGEVFVIRPKNPVVVSLAERDADKLQALYEEGRAVCKERLAAMQAYLSTDDDAEKNA